jgi:hypothetical protein
LGYGRGELEFMEVSGMWRWHFNSTYESLERDNLPADAWTGFLKEPAEFASTRLNFRPFTIAEQRNILTVGACLTCHDDNSSIMQQSLRQEFDTYLSTISSECRIPIFE